MGCSDLIQLVFIGLNSGVSCLIPYQLPYAIRKLLGAMAAFGWFTYVSLSQAMTFNRLISIYWPHNIKIIFASRTTITIICLSWLHGFAWLITDCTSCYGIIFSVGSYGLDIEMASSGTQVALLLNIIIDWSHAASMVIVYILIYIKVYLRKNKISDESVKARNNKERKVLLQAVLLCSMDVATVVLFILFQTIPENRWTSLLGNSAWLISAGGNSFIYLAISKTIRQKFLEIFGFKKYSINKAIVLAYKVKSSRHIPVQAGH